jgi:hypothetical protein
VHATDRPFWFTLDGDSNYVLRLDPLSDIWESHCKTSLLCSDVNVSNRNNVTFNEMWTEIAMWASEACVPGVSGSDVPSKASLPSNNIESDRNMKVQTPKDENVKKGTLSKAGIRMAKDSVHRFVLSDGTCRQTSTPF